MEYNTFEIFYWEMVKHWTCWERIFRLTNMDRGEVWNTDCIAERSLGKIFTSNWCLQDFYPSRTKYTVTMSCGMICLFVCLRERCEWDGTFCSMQICEKPCANAEISHKKKNKQERVLTWRLEELSSSKLNDALTRVQSDDLFWQFQGFFYWFIFTLLKKR